MGRNNVQNDRLTLRESRGNDIWFHTQKIPGSHVIVVTEGREVPNRTLEQACILAATHSQAAESAKVPVDYTQVRYVKKPNGAKPGMVIYETYQTACKPRQGAIRAFESKMNPEHSGPLRPLYLFLEEKMKKLCKKVLTSAGKHDIITKLSDADGARQKGL